MIKPRILWAAPFNLHDTSSGAAISMRLMLRRLAREGLEVRAMSCFVFDAPTGRTLFSRYEEEVEQSDKEWFELDDGGLACRYMKTASWNILEFTEKEQRVFFGEFCRTLNVFRPDVLMMYGGGVLEYAMRAEAHLRGVKNVYVVCNGNHCSFTFPFADMVLTDSRATAQAYARQSAVNMRPVGVFIDREAKVAPQRDPKYITFVNPSPSKGLSIVARLAHMARRELPEERFMVVQSRGDWFSGLPLLTSDENPEFHFTREDFPNVDVVRHITDMRPVYAVSKILLVPSLWYESWGMVATEAVLNGIPVLASRNGGLPEAVGEGGLTLPAPQACHLRYERLPTEEEMRPWMDALQDMCERKKHWRKQALHAAEAYAPERAIERVREALEDMFLGRASANPQFYRAGCSPTY